MAKARQSDPDGTLVGVRTSELVGYEFAGDNDALKGLGLNLSYSQSDGFGGGISYSSTTEGGTKVTGGLNYSKQAGVGASLNAQKELSKSDTDNYSTTLTGGVSFSQKQGFGASVDATIEKVTKTTPGGQSPVPKPQFQSVSQMDMGLSFNQKEGFSASLGFDGINALSYITRPQAYQETRTLEWIGVPK
ncbi:hypothetical protein [Leptospira meyeri]|uniref:hypothetical protein n=1 Tax=Leptospira meyeri TaxID=29508 RepID=UPI0010839BAE|nr:hypothetical protein [Leptospira meyeri]TGL11235.1 hypothetical protein EHQ50_15980 [Leptospira meyeri]